MTKAVVQGEGVPGVGHNQPPAQTPFDEISERIESLYEEARGWLDGEPIATQGQADELSKLIDMISTAAHTAEVLRKAEVKPFDDGKKEVQARYNPLIGDNKSGKGKAVLALSAAKQALTPWLERQEQLKREAEAKAQAEAEEAARAAEEARRKAVGDLAAHEEAERLEKEASKAQKAAKAASKDTAKAKGGEGRAISLRTYYRAEITDHQAFAQWMWQRQQGWLCAWLTTAADKLVAENPHRPIDGVTIHEEKRAV